MTRILLYLLLLIIPISDDLQAQVTAVPVTPESVSAFPRAPEKVARIGNRLFAVFGNQTQFLRYSDDEGATWILASTIPEYIADILAVDDQLFVFLVISSGNTRIFKVKKSTDSGVTFADVYSFQETKVENSGNYTNLCVLGKILSVNGHIYLNYYAQNKTGSTFTNNYRCKISGDGGMNWYSVDTGLHSRGPAENILYGNGHYILVSGAVSGSMSNGMRVYASASPDFSDYWELPFTVNTHSSHTSAFTNDQLVVIGNTGKVYRRNNFDPLQSFQTSDLPFQPWEAGFYNGFFYFLTYREIYRSSGDDPANAVKVFSNFSWQEFSTFFTRFVGSGNSILLLSDQPLRSDDGGLTWTSWVTQTQQQWAGEIYSLGSHLFLNNGWGLRAASGLDFQFWAPQGLPEAQLLQWEQITAHHQLLFTIATAPDISGDLTLFRSADGGVTWSSVSAFPGMDLVKMYTSGNRLFVLTKSATAAACTVYYSDDDGMSFQTFAGTVDTAPTAFAATGDTAYIISSTQFFFTHNAGQSWQSSIRQYVTNFNDFIFLNNGNPVICHSRSRIIEASDDGGQTFFQTAQLPGTAVRYKFWQFDTLLVAAPDNNGPTYISKGIGLKWISVYDHTFWNGMQYLALHNGYLYGTQRNYNQYTVPQSPFSRIPADQIIDPLNSIGAEAGVVKGTVFYDTNTNCSLNAGETALNGHIVTFNPGNYIATTNNNGVYARALPPGNYTVSMDTPDYHTLNCLAPAAVSLAHTQSIVKNAGFQPAVSVKDLRTVMSNTPLRPGRPVHFYIKIQNKGTLPVAAGNILHFYYPDGLLEVTFATPGFVQLPGEIQFVLPDMAPYTELSYQVSLVLEADPGLMGQVLAFTAAVPNNFGDVEPTNNLATNHVEVVNSFDPNDKKAITNAVDGSKMALSEKFLQYQIRFQNTGTDTAFHVVVRDTLSPLLEPTGIKTIATSHPYRFVLRQGRIAEWHFDPIILPDSTTNEAGSHGFILFRIPTQPNLEPGNILHNSAAIYFDFNPAVITNTTSTKMVRRLIWRDNDNTPDRLITVTVSPNPASSTVYFRITGDGQPEETAVRLMIRDVTGKLVKNELFSGDRYQWSPDNQPDGVYFWQIWTNGEPAGAGEVLLNKK